MNLVFSKSFVPEEKDSALKMGSGNLMVLSTPSLTASLENVAMNCVMSKLEEGYTTVGTLLNVKHLKASKIGQPYTAKATLIEEDKRRLIFHVEAMDEEGNLLAEGTHERFVVNIERFMGKL